MLQASALSHTANAKEESASSPEPSSGELEVPLWLI